MFSKANETLVYYRLPLATGATEGMAPPRGRDCHFLKPLSRPPVKQHKLRWIITLEQTTIMKMLPWQHPSDTIPTMFPRRQKCAFQMQSFPYGNHGNAECHYRGEADTAGMFHPRSRAPMGSAVISSIDTLNLHKYM